ncbi:hypothetical protein [Streptomyces gilvosporeus]|uniref:hypothetical protein n=1 Tax=Streptomyces gilvosporeus TaxID=553510 RepID=UPI00131E8A4A|nr:hypothetical protein [Streptomyces gilvosporeus]
MQFTTAALAYEAEFREILLAMAYTITFADPEAPAPAEDPAVTRRRELEDDMWKAFG